MLRRESASSRPAQGVVVPTKEPDEPPGSASHRHVTFPGPDTTSASSPAQDEAAHARTLSAPINHEVVANAGHDRAGHSVFLARETASSAMPTVALSASLIALFIDESNAGEPPVATVRVLERAAIARSRECHVCGTPRVDAVRFCEACGATLSIVVPSAPPADSAIARYEAVKGSTGEQLTLVGEMPASDGSSVYFAREPHPNSVLVALVPRSTEDIQAPGAELTLDAMPAIDAVQPSFPGFHAESKDRNEPTFPTPSVATAAIAEDPLVGGLIDGKYRVLRKLGQGGMGVVFDARHEQLRARRAIKVMHPHLQSRPDLVTRFYEEARNAERVKHEHVCTVHDFGSSDGIIYIAMEFIDGEPLSAMIKRQRRIASARVSTIVAQTAAALDAAHALKIIHRDVKPDNIMLARHEDGRDDVKVVDFGISKALNRSELTSGGTDTQFGVVIGTLDYMSEEQRQGQEVDSRTDVYALGRTAVRMLFGELPEHSAWDAWCRARVNPALGTVLSRALAPRDQRYASAGEFSRDLTRVLRSGSPDRDTGWRDRMQRLSPAFDAIRRPRVALGILGAAVLLAAVPFAARRFSKSGTDSSNGRSHRDTTAGTPTTASIDASPSAVKFVVENGVSIPARQSVRIKSLAGRSVDALGVGDIQYDGPTVDWLARPTWQDGNATAPALLTLEARAGGAPPGTYTAHVRVVSSASPSAAASITATLVVKASEKEIVRGPAGETGSCSASRTQLGRIRKLTDPLTGTPADARSVVAMVPALLPSLCSSSEQVEAQLRLAEAHMTLSQGARACEVLRGIENQAASTSFAANVRVYLSQCR
jgi:serine/threonine protein kinase